MTNPGPGVTGPALNSKGKIRIDISTKEPGLIHPLINMEGYIYVQTVLTFTKRVLSIVEKTIPAEEQADEYSPLVLCIEGSSNTLKGCLMLLGIDKEPVLSSRDLVKVKTFDREFVDLIKQHYITNSKYTDREILVRLVYTVQLFVKDIIKYTYTGYNDIQWDRLDQALYDLWVELYPKPVSVIAIDDSYTVIHKTLWRKIMLLAEDEEPLEITA
jgi:hypothetical protein